MTKLEQQRYDNDCALPCIAMALGVPYEKVHDSINPQTLKNIIERGTCDDEMNEIFQGLGLVNEQDYVKYTFGPYWGTVRYTKNLLWGRRAIVSAWSRNNNDGKHYVYWDGSEVFDPSTKEVYLDWDDVEPHLIWLFHENKK